MSDTTDKCTSCGTLALPLNILLVSFAILAYTMMQNTREQHKSLVLAPAQLEQQQQQLDQQLRQAGAAKQKYFALFSDLVELGKRDASAEALVTKYGIHINQPTQNETLATSPATATVAKPKPKP